MSYPIRCLGAGSQTTARHLLAAQATTRRSVLVFCLLCFEVLYFEVCVLKYTITHQ